MAFVIRGGVLAFIDVDAVAVAVALVALDALAFFVARQVLMAYHAKGLLVAMMGLIAANRSVLCSQERVPPG